MTCAMRVQRGYYVHAIFDNCGSPVNALASAYGYEPPWTVIVEAEPSPLELHALITAPERLNVVKSGCGAVAVGPAYLFPPLSFGGASLPEGFSHFVTSMTTPVASGRSDGRWALHPLEKRRLTTAHTRLRHSASMDRIAHQP